MQQNFCQALQESGHCFKIFWLWHGIFMIAGGLVTGRMIRNASNSCCYLSAMLFFDLCISCVPDIIQIVHACHFFLKGHRNTLIVYHPIAGARNLRPVHFWYMSLFEIYVDRGQVRLQKCRFVNVKTSKCVNNCPQNIEKIVTSDSENSRSPQTKVLEENVNAKFIEWIRK